MEKSDKILVGKEEICKVAGIGKQLFPDVISRGFPAVFWGGKWRAHRENVESWMKLATKPSKPQTDLAAAEDEDEPI
ncbi:MAG: hypothetical protein K9J79_03740 [Desulfobacteraceae bacterium]|nr:hypothetical protein [Desulfobacteraceae bacterium]